MSSKSKEENVEVGVLGSESKLKCDVSEEAMVMRCGSSWQVGTSFISVHCRGFDKMSKSARKLENP